MVHLGCAESGKDSECQVIRGLGNFFLAFSTRSSFYTGTATRHTIVNNDHPQLNVAVQSVPYLSSAQVLLLP
jgi:hypothetical protein